MNVQKTRVLITDWGFYIESRGLVSDWSQWEASKRHLNNQPETSTWHKKKQLTSEYDFPTANKKLARDTSKTIKSHHMASQ